MPYSNWSQPLPRPIVIPKVMKLKTLADVRTLMRHLPKDYQARPTWRHVAAELQQAAAGADTVDVDVALRLALMFENVESRSTALESISTRPSSRKRVSPSQRVSAYRIASAIVDFPETAPSCDSNQGFSASTRGLLRENRAR